MQTKLTSNNSSLKQGTIFSIKKIKLNAEKKLKFNDLYPEVNLKKITYGIILSQSCDLVKREKKLENRPRLKIPYITVALLEPIEKFIEQKYSQQANEVLSNYSFHHKKYIIINKKGLTKKLYKNYERLLGNHETFYFFTSIRKRMFYVNLVKTFPFKIMHYDTFAQNAKYELKTNFANKLGYMISYIYGRVGIPDYEKSQLSNLIELMCRKLISSLKDVKQEGKEFYDIESTAFDKIKNAKTEKEKNELVNALKIPKIK